MGNAAELLDFAAAVAAEAPGLDVERGARATVTAQSRLGPCAAVMWAAEGAVRVRVDPLERHYAFAPHRPDEVTQLRAVLSAVSDAGRRLNPLELRRVYADALQATAVALERVEEAHEGQQQAIGDVDCILRSGTLHPDHCFFLHADERQAGLADAIEACDRACGDGPSGGLVHALLVCAHKAGPQRPELALDALGRVRELLRASAGANEAAALAALRPKSARAPRR